MEPELADSALIATMEAKLRASFPALDSAQSHGVFVGSSMGVTGRANSASVVGDVDDAHAAIEWAKDWLVERAREPLFRLSPLAPAAFQDLLPVHAAFNATSCMHLPLDSLPATSHSSAVEITSDRPDDWIREGTEQRGAEIDALMDNVNGTLSWAVIRSHGSAAAAGRGVLVDGWLCVQSVYTIPQARGQGFGNQIVAALHNWATANNATDAFLNVGATNDPAQSVYRSLGYRSVYEYLYVHGVQG